MPVDDAMFLKQPPRIMGIDASTALTVLAENSGGLSRRNNYTTTTHTSGDYTNLLNSLVKSTQRIEKALTKTGSTSIEEKNLNGLYKEIVILNKRLKNSEAQSKVRDRKEEIYKRDNLRLSNKLLRQISGRKSKSTGNSTGSKWAEKFKDTLAGGIIDTLFPFLSRMGLKDFGKKALATIGGLGIGGLLLGKKFIGKIAGGVFKFLGEIAKSIGGFIKVGFTQLFRNLSSWIQIGIGSQLFKGGSFVKNASRGMSGFAGKGAKILGTSLAGWGLRTSKGAINIGTASTATKLLTDKTRAIPSSIKTVEGMNIYRGKIAAGDGTPAMIEKAVLKHEEKLLKAGQGTLIKGATKTSGKALGSSVLKTATKIGDKKVPVLGLAIGTGLAINRIAKGDWLGAGLEIASSLAATGGWAGGVAGGIAGLGVSAGIDTYLAKRDADRIAKGIDKPAKWHDSLDRFMKWGKYREGQEEKREETLADKLAKVFGNGNTATGLLFGALFGRMGGSTSKGLLSLFDVLSGGTGLKNFWENGLNGVSETTVPTTPSLPVNVNRDIPKVGTKEFDKLKEKYLNEYAQSKYNPNNPVAKAVQLDAYKKSAEAQKYAISMIAGSSLPVGSTQKYMPSQLTLSPQGERFIKNQEGKRNTIYSDLGKPASGYGHRLVGSELSMYGKNSQISDEQIETWWKQDRAKAESWVRKSVKVPITQGQFDALTDLAYNQGSLDIASGLIRNLNAGKDMEAASRFALYKHDASGRVLPVLEKRRLEGLKNLWGANIPLTEKVGGTIEQGYDATKSGAKWIVDNTQDFPVVGGLIQGIANVADGIRVSLKDMEYRTTTAKDEYLQSFSQQFKTVDWNKYNNTYSLEDAKQEASRNTVPSTVLSMPRGKGNDGISYSLPTLDIYSLMFIQSVTQQ